MSDSGVERMKREAARHSARWIEDGMRLGLGTGSTIRYLLDEISEQRAAGRWSGIVGVPTSEATRVQAERLGIPLGTLAEHPELDLTIDGADEVDPSLDLIKGLGAALLREKVVASASRSLIIVVDASKIVPRLGTKAPLPVEVDPFAVPVVEPFLLRLGARPTLRVGASGEPTITDGGNRILDCAFQDGIADARELERQLDACVGVMENGLFLGMADHVVVAGPDGTEVRSRAGSAPR